MAHGSKSKKRNAFRARVIKHFAQGLGLKGRAALVDFVAVGLATAVGALPEPPSDQTFLAVANAVGEKLHQHGLPFQETCQVIREAVAEMDRAFTQA